MPVRFLCSIHKEATRLSADSCDGASYNPWSAGITHNILFFFDYIMLLSVSRD